VSFGCEDPHHCVTCADEGVEMRVVAVDEARGLALCAAPGGARESVEIALVDAVAPGDALLVHAGTALTKLAPAQATA
jgi:hydrogenase expression/formation protein HypC